MATFTTTATVTDSGISRGGDGARPGVPDYGTRLRRARLGLLVALTPVFMLFVSFTSAYVVRQGLPSLDPRTATLVRDWIPVTLPKLLLINTFVLVLSSGFMELARRQIQGQARATLPTTITHARVSAGGETSMPWLPITVVLGLLFLFGQWTAWKQLAANGFYVATTPSSSFVYLLTGTHAVHLMGGVLALFVAGVASLLGISLTRRSIVVDVTAWYWHFMAALWIYILCLMEFAK
ncbi:MAG TPA: cytochrome c oxidase subunit 3 [Candidatus Acidoferrum sp.]|nr:cytochrome c oxidase subunit 3 [Candidatus Acidoferrum sp.]